MKKIGVISVTYNSAKVLDDFFISILKQSYTNFVLYIVDNSSTDSSTNIIQKHTDSVALKLILQTKNTGFASASNVGIKAAIEDKCDFILLINNDTVFNSDLFASLLKPLLNNSIDMAAPKMLFADNPNRIWCAGGGFSKFKAMGNVQYGQGEIDNGQYNQDHLVDFVPMCCVLINAECFHRIGYLDEKYFVYYEDADWFYRSKRYGLKLLYVHNAVIYHKVSSITGGNESDFSSYELVKNRVYYIKKNFKGLTKLCFLFYIAVTLIVKLLNRTDTWQKFKLKIKAYIY